MKVAERVITQLISKMVSLDKIQFGFVPRRSTTDALFLVKQLQEKYLVKSINIC